MPKDDRKRLKTDPPKSFKKEAERILLITSQKAHTGSEPGTNKILTYVRLGNSPPFPGLQVFQMRNLNEKIYL